MQGKVVPPIIADFTDDVHFPRADSPHFGDFLEEMKNFMTDH
jgi:hypothetical protein